MPNGLARQRHFRIRSGEQRITNLELFFDLVFVFVITQLASRLYEHVSWSAIGQTTLLFLAVWWAWIYTTWMTNWFDPDLLPVRLILIAVMLAGLLLGIAIPHAFGADAILFASSYVALQVARNSFNLWSVRLPGTERTSFLRILVWSVWTGTIIVVGAVAGGSWLLPLWCAGLALDYLGPALGYWAPRIGRSSTTDWDLDGGHFAERVQLFVMIALGEGVAVVGLTAGHSALTLARVTAVAVAFLTSAAMWWLYFNFMADRARDRLRTDDDPGGLARDAFTYIHFVIVAGIIATAVADHQLILRPASSAVDPFVTVAGPALYLIGNNLFRLRMVRGVSTARMAGTIALIALGVIAGHVQLIVTASLVLLTLVLIIIRERSLPLPPPLFQAN